MRKIIIGVLIILTLGFYVVHTNASGNINLKLKNQIGIIFVNKNMILIQDEYDATLLVIDNDPDINKMSKFKYPNLHVVMLGDNKIDIKYDEKIILKDTYEEDGVKIYKRSGLVYINYLDTNTCIYTGGAYNISDCEFVYFHNTNLSNVILHDYNEIILSYYKNPLSKNILQDIYDRSIDTYQIRDDEIAIIRIGKEDYDFIVLSNE
jgi:hypothetical protein